MDGGIEGLMDRRKMNEWIENDEWMGEWRGTFFFCLCEQLCESNTSEHHFITNRQHILKNTVYFKIDAMHAKKRKKTNNMVGV